MSNKKKKIIKVKHRSKTPKWDRIMNTLNSPEEIEKLKKLIKELYITHENEIIILKDRIAALEKQLKDLGLRNTNSD